MSPLHLDNISFDKENIHGVFNTKFTYVYWLDGIVYYAGRGANTRGNGNNLANGSSVETNLFKASSELSYASYKSLVRIYRLNQQNLSLPRQKMLDFQTLLSTRRKSLSCWLRKVELYFLFWRQNTKHISTCFYMHFVQLNILLKDE